MQKTCIPHVTYRVHTCKRDAGRIGETCLACLVVHIFFFSSVKVDFPIFNAHMNFCPCSPSRACSWPCVLFRWQALQTPVTAAGFWRCLCQLAIVNCQLSTAQEEAFVYLSLSQLTAGTAWAMYRLSHEGRVPTSVSN